jgi:hypothetical protein
MLVRLSVKYTNNRLESFPINLIIFCRLRIYKEVWNNVPDRCTEIQTELRKGHVTFLLSCNE